MLCWGLLGAFGGFWELLLGAFGGFLGEAFGLKIERLGPMFGASSAETLHP